MSGTFDHLVAQV